MLKRLITISGFFTLLTFGSLTYANSCPGSENCPIDATVLAYLKTRGVPQSEIVMANQYLQVYVAKLSTAPSHER